MSSDPSPPPPSAPASVQDESVSEARIQACLQEADTLKQEGNDLFRASKWEAALSTYRSALGRLPKRIEHLAPVPPRRDDAIDDDTPEEFSTAPPSPVDEEGSTSPPPHAAELSKARATLNANIAACFVKLGDHKEVVSACSEALKDDPSYTKALTRRAAANEALNTWSSLSAAQEDYEKLLTLVPAAETGKIRATLNKVKPRAEAAQRQEMGEMVDKLKGLGNSLLGNFGLSTDNFKFEPNGQGGYSVNFSR